MRLALAAVRAIRQLPRRSAKALQVRCPVPGSRPENRKKALVHRVVLNPLVPVVDITDLGRMEAAFRGNAMGDQRPARLARPVAVGTVPGTTRVHRTAPGGYFHANDVHALADRGRRLP